MTYNHILTLAWTGDLNIGAEDLGFLEVGITMADALRAGGGGGGLSVSIQKYWGVHHLGLNYKVPHTRPCPKAPLVRKQLLPPIFFIFHPDLLLPIYFF